MGSFITGKMLNSEILFITIITKLFFEIYVKGSYFKQISLETPQTEELDLVQFIQYSLK